MARPLRIEFPGAWYHVMNRGLAYHDIYLANQHREIFLDLCDEISEIFAIEIHGYCLMDNHYHLLIHTPLGNLGRAMRHLNGVYTQRFNRLESLDGPLFRGRYKSILVEKDSYLLQVSRYIHLNPLGAEIVSSLSNYQWSSYSAYIGEINSPSWLHTHMILSMLNQKQKQNQRENHKTYREFIEQGNTPQIADYYTSKRSPVLGSTSYQDKIRTGLKQNEKELPELKLISTRPTLLQIVNVTAQVYGASSEQLTMSHRDFREARKLAVYLCRYLGQYPLSDIAAYFNLTHYASASNIIYNIKKRIADDVSLKNKAKQIKLIIYKT